MRALAMAAMLGVLWGSAALGSGRGPAAETPRATDLLRAKRLAEEVEDRRRLPPPATKQGWKRGGGGWSAPGSSRGAGGGTQAGNVSIHVAPAKPRRTRKEP